MLADFIPLKSTVDCGTWPGPRGLLDFFCAEAVDDYKRVAGRRTRAVAKRAGESAPPSCALTKMAGPRTMVDRFPVPTRNSPMTGHCCLIPRDLKPIGWCRGRQPADVLLARK